MSGNSSKDCHLSDGECIRFGATNGARKKRITPSLLEALARLSVMACFPRRTALFARTTRILSVSRYTHCSHILK